MMTVYQHRLGSWLGELQHCQKRELARVHPSQFHSLRNHSADKTKTIMFILTSISIFSLVMSVWGVHPGASKCDLTVMEEERSLKSNRL